MIFATVEAPEKSPDLETSDGSGAGEWVVAVYDNDYNTHDEVATILMIATGCGIEEAAMETWEIHHLGKSIVHHGTKAECEKVAAVIVQIGIEVRIYQE